MEAPVSVIFPLEFTVVSDPLQVGVGPESATVNAPAGKVSVKLIPDRSPPAKLFGLAMVKFRLTNPPSATVEEANDFIIVGGPTTVRFAVAVPPAPVLVPPLVEPTFPVVLV